MVAELQKIRKVFLTYLYVLVGILKLQLENKCPHRVSDVVDICKLVPVHYLSRICRFVAGTVLAFTFRLDYFDPHFV